MTVYVDDMNIRAVGHVGEAGDGQRSLAHMVGDTGRVTAIEYDLGLAARLAVNFAGQPMCVPCRAMVPGSISTRPT